MIKIRKVFNSNIVLAIDEQGKEIVIIGRGIGFGKNCDDIADEKKIQKIFYCAGNPQESRMLKLLKDLDSQKNFIIKKPVDPHKTKGLPVYF